MDIRAAEISDIIRKQIENYDKKVSVTETGTVLTAGDGIARVYGLAGALAGELLEFEGAGGENRGDGDTANDHGSFSCGWEAGASESARALPCGP